MPKISVIVPVYRVEEYLDRCVASVCAQTFRDWELILVDDGSPDQCGVMCDAWVEKDERIRVIHRKNGGPSAARNSGIIHASGEYLLFVDADDQLFPSAMQSMVDYAEQTMAELVLGGYRDQSPYGEVDVYEFASGIETKERLIEAVIHGTGGVLWAKLFKTEIVIENKLQLNCEVRFSEDMLFVLEYIKHIRRWGSVDAPLYMYNRMNETSLTRKKDESLMASYAVFAVELKMILTQLGMDSEKSETIVDQRVVNFTDEVLKNAKHPQDVYGVLCGNSVFFAAITSKNVVLPKSLQFAKQKKWGHICILGMREVLRSRVSIAWHRVLKVKNK